ncbi:hypothetical protein [Planctomycetes bacterium K23_9]|uniref:Uncharacterized protein n=1 Tax=Stieleria marina TaxID=1930275 RepID=A0A517NVH3_9BACT|nr:hypothetical protein K239x_31170 [Planctomycetes bacterium K23_9]
MKSALNFEPPNNSSAATHYPRSSFERLRESRSAWRLQRPQTDDEEERFITRIILAMLFLLVVPALLMLTYLILRPDFLA